MIDHLRKEHRADVSEEQIPLTLTLSEQPIGDDTIVGCPLCPAELAMVRLLHHIAEHLDEISIFVLPRLDEESEEDRYSSLAGDSRTNSEPASKPGADVLDPETQTLGAGTIHTTDHDSEDPGIALLDNTEDWTRVFNSVPSSTLTVKPDPILLSLENHQNKDTQAEKLSSVEDPGHFTTTSQLVSFINGNIVECDFRGEVQEFLPRPALNKATTIDVIRTIVSEDSESFFDQKEQETFVHEVFERCRKIFITCVFGELPMTVIKALMVHGLSDAEFPLCTEDCPSQIVNRQFRLHFIRNQKIFHAAYFEFGTNQVLDDKFTVPIDFEISFANVLADGVFDYVFKIQIHPDQRSFSNVSYSKSPNLILSH
jgi:hypothetical protein